MVDFFVRIYTRRDLLWYLIVSDLKRSYANKVLGYLWSFLDPLALLVVYSVLVSVIFQKGGPQFPLLVLVGILSWQWFSLSIASSVQAITNKTSIILSVSFPLAILPLAVVGTHTCRFLLASMILVPFLYVYDANITWQVLWWPVVIGLQLLFTVALGLIVSILGVYFKDIQNIVPFLLRIWFYASPVLYSVEMHVPQKYRDIFYIINPLAGVIASYKNILVYGKLPSAYVLVVVCASVLLLLFSAAVFSIYEKKIPKII